MARNANGPSKSKVYSWKLSIIVIICLLYRLHSHHLSIIIIISFCSSSRWCRAHLWGNAKWGYAEHITRAIRKTSHRKNANDKLRQMRCSSARVRAPINAFALLGSCVCARASFLSFPFRVWNGVPIFRHDFIIILKTCLRDARCVCALACCREIEYHARRHGRPDVEAIPWIWCTIHAFAVNYEFMMRTTSLCGYLGEHTHTHIPSVLRMNQKF